MKLKDIYIPGNFNISYEIFPPKGENTELNQKIQLLFEELAVLAKHNPAFISVTYGAGGSTREKTLELVLKIKNELGIKSVPHFTCVGSSKEEILDYLKIIEKENIKDVLALRGDPPKGEKEFIKPENGFRYANELVEFIKHNINIGIAVAGYPEGHQESVSLDNDIVNLKKKIDAGADLIITQLFFDNSKFFNFLEKIWKAGINVPVIPGILPAISLTQLEKVILFSNATLPEKLVKKLAKFENDPEAMKKAGIEYTIEQCKELKTNNVCGIHFYTFNKAFAVNQIVKEMNIEPQPNFI